MGLFANDDNAIFVVDGDRGSVEGGCVSVVTELDNGYEGDGGVNGDVVAGNGSRGTRFMDRMSRCTDFFKVREAVKPEVIGVDHFDHHS